MNSQNPGKPSATAAVAAAAPTATAAAPLQAAAAADDKKDVKIAPADLTKTSGKLQELYAELAKIKFAELGANVIELQKAVDNIIKAWEKKHNVDLSKKMLNQFVLGELPGEALPAPTKDRYGQLCKRLAIACMIYGCKYLQEHGKSTKRLNKALALDLIKAGINLFNKEEQDLNPENKYSSVIVNLQTLIKGANQDSLIDAVNGLIDHANQHKNKEPMNAIRSILQADFDKINKILKPIDEVKHAILRDAKKIEDTVMGDEKNNGLSKKEKDNAIQAQIKMLLKSRDAEISSARAGSLEQAKLLLEQRDALAFLITTIDRVKKTQTTTLPEFRAWLAHGRLFKDADTGKIEKGDIFFDTLSKQTPTGTRIGSFFSTEPSIIDKLSTLLSAQGFSKAEPDEAAVIAAAEDIYVGEEANMYDELFDQNNPNRATLK